MPTVQLEPLLPDAAADLASELRPARRVRGDLQPRRRGRLLSRMLRRVPGAGPHVSFTLLVPVPLVPRGVRWEPQPLPCMRTRTMRHRGAGHVIPGGVSRTPLRGLVRRSAVPGRMHGEVSELETRSRAAAGLHGSGLRWRVQPVASSPTARGDGNPRRTHREIDHGSSIVARVCRRLHTRRNGLHG